jgi:hypothetical protein
MRLYGISWLDVHCFHDSRSMITEFICEGSLLLFSILVQKVIDDLVLLPCLSSATSALTRHKYACLFSQFTFPSIITLSPCSASYPYINNPSSMYSSKTQPNGSSIEAANDTQRSQQL